MTELPIVTVTKCLTINVGNYQSLKIEAGVTIPVNGHGAVTTDDMSNTLTKATQMVNSYLRQQGAGIVKDFTIFGIPNET